MALTRTLRKNGNSLQLTIPSQLCEAYDLKAGATITLVTLAQGIALIPGEVGNESGVRGEAVSESRDLRAGSPSDRSLEQGERRDSTTGVEAKVPSPPQTISKRTPESAIDFVDPDQRPDW